MKLGVARVVLGLLRLCRLYYAVPMSFILGLTIAYCHDGDMAGQWSSTFTASAALGLVIAAVYLFNELCDRKVDRLNAPGRPLASGQVPTNVAAGWALLLCAAGLGIAYAWGRPAFAALLSAVAAAMAAYDVWSKRLGIGKQIVVAALMTSFYPLALAQAGSVEGGRGMTLLFFPLWLFLTSFGYEVLKDIRDCSGDWRASGRATWIRARPRLARRAASIAVIAGACVLIVSALVGCGRVYAMLLPLPMIAGVLSAVLPIRSAMGLIYVECVLVGVATTADLIAA